jgi:ADP-dependent phosphofructokinase/glucokinase
VPPDEYPKVFAVFNDNRDAIYALYRDEIGRLLRKETVDATLRYFDEFYRTINNPRMAKEAIVDGCLGKK